MPVVDQAASPAELGPLSQAADYRLACVARADSTNRMALGRAAEGAEGQLWVVAREQTAGRGRLGRPWVSPPGNLYASLLLIDPSPPPQVPQLGFVAGIALREAVTALLPPDAPVQLKWPNDLLVGGAKAAGILLEGTQLADGRFAVVLGIGVNVASAPTGFAYPVSCLAAHGGETDAGGLFARLSDRLVHWRGVWNSGSGFAAVRLRWLECAAGLGGSVSVTRAGDRITGIFRDIDAQGRLVLETGSGLQVVDAGDMTPGDPAGQYGF